MTKHAVSNCITRLVGGRTIRKNVNCIMRFLYEIDDLWELDEDVYVLIGETVSEYSEELTMRVLEGPTRRTTEGVFIGRSF